MVLEVSNQNENNHENNNNNENNNNENNNNEKNNNNNNNENNNNNNDKKHSSFAINNQKTTFVCTNKNDDMMMDSGAVDIPMAYRQATDEDTREVLNAMSDMPKTPTIFFYVVPCSFMKTVESFLNGRSGYRPQTKIANEGFLKSPGEKKLRSDLVHEIHFYLLGSHAWTLLSSKFGFDVELGYRVVPHGNAGVLMVDLVNQKVLIPPTGRFSYGASKTDVVSDDETDDMFPGPSGVNGDQDINNRIITTSAAVAANVQEKSRAIILLPSSNTKMNSRIDGMDFQREKPEDGRKHQPLKRKRYGSGLGNLGNTCFMNSTLQCLAHTEPLRCYFVSGEYEEDINRDNPLGTGGELATQFAELLAEMWGVKPPSSTYTSTGGVIYPRSFKDTLGKYAKQFMGYDQHDSQELATYLLDALHEDTNRVTKKPYIEKPEQEDDEPDSVAADKAWNLHLKREDSRVLENFMGLVKSRVQCPKEGCGRVSTTFDPVMYLSVPIPGASDRTLKVTFVPLGASNQNMNITLSKTASISALQKGVCELWEKISGKNVDPDNIMAADVWSNEIYAMYSPDDDVDKIKDTDTPYLYELAPASDFVSKEDSDDEDEYQLKQSNRKLCSRFKLNLKQTTSLNGEGWKDTLDWCVKQGTLVPMLLNPQRGTIADRVRFYETLETFLDNLHMAEQGECDAESSEDDDIEPEEPKKLDSSCEGCQSPSAKTYSQVTNESSHFQNVSTDYHVAMLEFVSKKFRKFTLDMIAAKKAKRKEGFEIQILLQKRNRTPIGFQRTTERHFVPPLCLRISAGATVYELRQELARRLPIKTDRIRRRIKREDEGNDDANESRFEVEPNDSGTNDRFTYIPSNEDPALFVISQIPLSYERKSYYSCRSSSYSSRQLGKLAKTDNMSEDDELVRAEPEGEGESLILSDVIGQQGSVTMHWPTHLCDDFFDMNAYDKADEANPEDDPFTKSKSSKKLTVKDCIDKHCQMEQLEESETWYCDRCKEHVRAWKQFHLYRTPPILIVHLKRFHYSASSHRRDKIDQFIDFPLLGLDLTSEVMEYEEHQPPIYDCYAVSNHYGRLGGGHYTAYAMSDDGVWCDFDDSRVTASIDPSQVVSSAAYVLYYKRRDVVYQTPGMPMPAIVQDHQASGYVVVHSNLIRADDSMDIDEKAPDTDTSPMDREDEDSFYQNDTELPAQ